MLTWLGMKRETGSPRARQFFGGASKRAVVSTLAVALAVMLGIRVGLTKLLPEAVLADPLGAVLPGVVGLLVAIVLVGVGERVITEGKP